MDHPPRKKSRKGAKKASAKKRAATQQGGELINIDDVEGDEDEEDESDDGPRSHQKGFYKGDKKVLIEEAQTKFRLYLFNMNAFPNAEEMVDWSKKCFTNAGMDLYGARFHGKGTLLVPKRTLTVSLNSFDAGFHFWDPKACRFPLRCMLCFIVIFPHNSLLTRHGRLAGESREVS